MNKCAQSTRPELFSCLEVRPQAFRPYEFLEKQQNYAGLGFLNLYLCGFSLKIVRL